MLYSKKMERVCCTSDEGQENGVDCKCEVETTQDQKIEGGRTEEGEIGWKKVRVQREEEQRTCRVCTESV